MLRPALPPALVFDFDGTLIDSVPDITQALNETLAHFDRRALGVDEVRTMVGDGSGQLLRSAFAATGETLDDAGLPAALQHYTDTYFTHSAEPSCLYPGVRATLESLHAAGVKLGLCTNKPERIARKLVDILGLAPVLPVVAGGDTLPVRKPDGAPVAWVMERLGTTAAVMVGDGRNDVLAARAVGIPVVVVSYGYPRMPVEALGADIIIDHFADLPDALARLAH